MNVHQAATLLGLGRLEADLFWTVVDNPVAHFKPIHDETQSLFIHIPKTAGVSFHQAMYDKSREYGHAPAVAFRQRDPERFAKYWKFAFMRDPVDRFISAFYYLTTNPHNQRDAEYGQKHMVKFGSVSNLVNEMQNPITRAKVMAWVHFRPQSWFLTDRSGKVLVDFIGRTEEFNETLPYIAHKLGVAYTPTRANVSKRTRENELDAAQRAFVAGLYTDDFALYESHAKSAPVVPG